MTNQLVSYDLHPCTEIFYEMTKEEFEELKSSIQNNGLLEPIKIWKGKVIDGRHRLKACQELKVSPRTEDVICEESEILSKVFAWNYHRRHLTIQQRAIIAARMVKDNKVGAPVIAGEPAITQSNAAKLLNVSRDSVQRVVAINKHRPDLIPKLESGKLSIAEAYAHCTPRNLEEDANFIKNFNSLANPDSPDHSKVVEALKDGITKLHKNNALEAFESGVKNLSFSLGEVEKHVSPEMYNMITETLNEAFSAIKDILTSS